ncbi:MAG: hypothetical protein AAB152_01885 [Candidatus Coatesbacteria bacterium]
MRHAGSLTCLHVLAAGLCLAVPVRVAAADVSRYEGMTALVVAPEHRWDWDAAIYGALAARGFAVTYVAPGALPPLAGFDLVATGARRSFPERDVEKLAAWVSAGGALYGSWGGPFATPGLLKLCRVRGTKSAKLKEIALVPGTPLAAGFETSPTVELSLRAGHVKADADGWELVVLDPEPDATTMAATADGRALGVFGNWGAGRAALLGFGPEMARHFADPAQAGRLLDNLLGWLLEPKLTNTMTGCSGRVALALPAGTVVKTVAVNGDPVPFTVTPAGTFVRVSLDLSRVRNGATGLVEARYTTPPGRRVETLVHLPWNTLVSAAASPAGLADWLSWLGATVCQPLLRGSDGTVWYKGRPGDRPVAALAKGYRGDFLADLIKACHARGIKVWGGAYLDNTVVRDDLQRGRVGRDGKPLLDRWGRPLACFNHPENQAAELAELKRLLADYALDGLVLDDNFELDVDECFGVYCVQQFKRYCARTGADFIDPAKVEEGSAFDAWLDCRRQATRALVRALAPAAAPSSAGGRKVVFGGWTGSTPRAELAGAFDVTGCMVYAAPASAVRLPVAMYGGRVTCLLWEPDAVPADLEADAREAVQAGAAVVGFWIRAADGGWRIDDERADAIRRAFKAVQETWTANLRDTILTGDPRYEVVEGVLARDHATLTVRNAGARVARRTAGPVDLEGLLPPVAAPGTGALP